jgi:nucleoid-associated protein YgaU
VYGHGRYHDVIREANRDVDPTTLRAGQTLTIPPLPERRAPGAGNGATGGTTVTPGTGERVYTVAEGDAGFWGIAQNVYGNGKYWPLIQRANRDVEPTALQPGQQLIIPPLPEDAGTRNATRSGPPRPTGAAGPGKYVVQPGDAGFWGIAQNVYGNGNLYPALERANPDVNPRSLRVGQVINVPPASEIETQPALPRLPRRDVEYDDRPIFD